MDVFDDTALNTSIPSRGIGRSHVLTRRFASAGCIGDNIRRTDATRRRVSARLESATRGRSDQRQSADAGMTTHARDG